MPRSTAYPARMTQVIHDKPDQLARIQANLMEGEQLFAVYDGKGVGTGFLGITDRRLILQDNSFVGGKTALTSIPFRRINTVSFVSDKSVIGWHSSSAISVSVGGREHEIELRGEDKARHAHNLILWGMNKN